MSGTSNNCDRPLVSIIMAAYNAEQTIASSILSVRNQAYDNWELLVINDYSQDNTQKIVSEFASSDSRIRLINNSANSGVSISRKKAVDAAKGAWIAVLDSDDMWTQDKLEKQIKLVQDKDAELVFTGSAFMDSEGNRIDWQLHVPEKLTYRELLKQNLISNSSVLVKADLYKKFYAVGDDMHEDFAIWLGITKTGRIAYGIDEPLLVYRIAKQSKSSNKLKAAKMNWNTYHYVGLNIIEATYYMCWYIVRSIMKYKHLK